jgi:hypothetical protein
MRLLVLGLFAGFSLSPKLSGARSKAEFYTEANNARVLYRERHAKRE